MFRRQILVLTVAVSSLGLVGLTAANAAPKEKEPTVYLGTASSKEKGKPIKEVEPPGHYKRNKNATPTTQPSVTTQPPATTTPTTAAPTPTTVPPAPTTTVTPPSTTVPPVTPPKPVGGPTDTFELMWADEFNKTSLDTSKWATSEPWGTNGFTHEDAYFPQPTGDLVAVENGNLVIRTRARSNPAGKPMVSGMVTTRGKQSFTTGYMETRVQIPTGKSLWPAWWLLGDGTGSQGWPATGELDMFEFVNNGREDAIPFFTAHWSPDGTVNNHAQYTYQWPARMSNLEGRWVTFGLHRTSTSATIYIDGVKAHSISTANNIPADPVFTDPMHMRFETQVGGGWAGHPDGHEEGDFVVDYVRYYR